jgi:hypothetical protein
VQRRREGASRVSRERFSEATLGPRLLRVLAGPAAGPEEAV